MMKIIHKILFSGSGAGGKMLLVRIIGNIKIMLTLGQVRLNTDKLCPAGLGKGLG